MENFRNAYENPSNVQKLSSRQLSHLLAQVRNGEVAIGHNLVHESIANPRQKHVVFVTYSVGKDVNNVSLSFDDQVKLKADVSLGELYSVIQRPIKKPAPSKKTTIYNVIQRPIKRPNPSSNANNSNESKRILVKA